MADPIRVPVKKVAPQKPVAGPIHGYFIFSVADNRLYMTNPQLVVHSHSMGLGGRPGHETPNTSGWLRYIRTLPNWTAPPSVVNGPNARFNNKSLLELYATLEGQARLIKEGFDLSEAPKKFVIPSNPHAPLGLATFMFDNPHSVYLHGTPDNKAFDKVRAGKLVTAADLYATAGCVRLPPEVVRNLVAFLAPGDERRTLYLMSLLKETTPDGKQWANPLQYDSKGQLVDYRNKTLNVNQNIWVMFTQDPVQVKPIPGITDSKLGQMVLNPAQKAMLPKAGNEAQAAHGQPQAVSAAPKAKDGETKQGGWTTKVNAAP
ncbi:MAG: L,D-transpeptidase family protein [Proteobacteria bacterium]|nr:L,D-transpeptidase family protein [Pseudomonadota bacterium]